MMIRTVTTVPWMPFIFLIVLAAVFLAAVVAIIVIFFLVIGRVCGWRRLAETYPTMNPPPGNLVHRQTVKIGAVTYKCCATVGVADEGLYLAIWRRKVLIPWSEIKSVGQEMLYWQTMPRLMIGEPPVATVTLPPAIFAMLRGRLPADLMRG